METAATVTETETETGTETEAETEAETQAETQAETETTVEVVCNSQLPEQPTTPTLRGGTALQFLPDRLIL